MDWLVHIFAQKQILNSFDEYFSCTIILVRIFDISYGYRFHRPFK